MILENVVLIAAGTLTALLAGVFFGYAVSVNWGLARLKDSEYVRAMQSINIVIINPLFMLSFMGPAVLLPLAAFLFRGEPGFGLLLAASIVYILGTFIVTIAGNVPLNDKLAKLRVEESSDIQLAAARKSYEKPWNNLHAVRTAMAVIATILIFTAATVR